MTAEQQACEEHFITHTTQQPDGSTASKTRSNNIEDSPCPCLTALVMGKIDVYWLSSRTVALDSDMVLISFPRNLKCKRLCFVTVQFNNNHFAFLDLSIYVVFVCLFPS
jgi:hypothetical protein